MVTRLVKVLRSPSTLPEKVCTLPTTEAAKSAPGKAEEPRPMEGVGVAGPGTEPVEIGR